MGNSIKLIGLCLLCTQLSLASNVIRHSTCEIQLVSKPATIVDRDTNQVSRLELIKDNNNLLWSSQDEEVLRKKGFQIRKDILTQEQSEIVSLEQEASENNRLVAFKATTVEREFREVFAGEGYTKFDCMNKVQISDSANLQVIYEADGDQFYKTSYTSSSIPNECRELTSNLEGLPNCRIK